jgi:hypothetical protein
LAEDFVADVGFDADFEAGLGAGFDAGFDAVLAVPLTGGTAGVAEFPGIASRDAPASCAPLSCPAGGRFLDVAISFPSAG